MYPSNGIQDTSLFLFSDNMYTNPSSTNQDFSFTSLLNVFPSNPVNFYDEAVFFQDFQGILHQKGNGQEMDQEMMVTHEGASNTNMSKIDVKQKKLSCGGSSKLREQIRVKRRCHKDRHSKIITANGSSRGRRMRLSVNVAKEFFALQDMLRYGKASETVAWLLQKSENAIKEVTTNRAGMSPSPCLSTSAIDELDPERVTTKEKTRGAPKVSGIHPSTRGLREKARARARERTRKKKQLQLVGGFTDNDQSRLYDCSKGMSIGSDHPSLNCDKSAAASNKFFNISNSSPAPVLEVEDILNYSKQQQHSFEGNTNTEELTNDNSFFVSNDWDPYTFFNFHHNSTTTL
ncbi:uncharacterized protein LOC141672891 isoform X2 [Apium graveolens]|uniref:uncharacterized protein LOC141672891 isoform X2 n=1 Tax=Apium graveolens TaxID=4045 RepID=UPI003D78CFA2